MPAVCHAYMHTRTRARAHTHARTHTRTHTHTRTRARTHTHTQVTDACLGWDETEKILKAFSRAVKTFRERESQEAAARREQMAGTRTGGQDPNGKMMKAFSRIQQH